MGEMGANLAADLGNILDDPAFGDVSLVTQDNDLVLACRFILSARCEVFHDMLMNDTKISELSLPSITTSALLPTLEFIYTGRLSKHGITIENIIDVLHASRFFLLTHLHQLALSFFSSQSLDQLRPHGGRLLSRAVEVLSPEADIEIFPPLLSIMTDSLLDIDNVGEVSCDALCYYLKQTRIVGIGISTYEYIRLRYVLIWCAQSVSKEVEEALKKCMPAQPLEPLSSGSLEQKVQDCSLLSMLNPIKSSFKASFEPWLHYLDLYWVHPQILARVVEPMGIIPLAHLSNVFRFQAMFSNELLVLRWKEGAHHSSYVILEGGCVIEHEVNVGYGFAMTEAPITSSTGIFEWDIVVERSSPYVGIGFSSTGAMAANVGSETGWLGNMYFGWVFGSNGNICHANVLKFGYAKGFGEGDRIRVHVDLSKRTCSFTVNEVHCGIAWTNIPAQIYPAVSMKFPGRVRIEAALNEDKLRWLKQFE